MTGLYSIRCSRGVGKCSLGSPSFRVAGISFSLHALNLMVSLLTHVIFNFTLVASCFVTIGSQIHLSESPALGFGSSQASISKAFPFSQLGHCTPHWHLFCSWSKRCCAGCCIQFFNNCILPSWPSTFHGSTQKSKYDKQPCLTKPTATCYNILFSLYYSFSTFLPKEEIIAHSNMETTRCISF